MLAAPDMRPGPSRPTIHLTIEGIIMSSKQTGNPGSKDQPADSQATGASKQSEADGSRNAATGAGNASGPKAPHQIHKMDEIDSSEAKGSKPSQPAHPSRPGGGRP
jgi:hypothetical protein